VAGQASAPAPTARFSYLPPVVTAVSPRTAPTSGLDAATGARVVLAINGSNLGVNGSVALVAAHALALPPAEAAAIGAYFAVTFGDVLSWSDSSITIYCPPGLGGSLYAVVTGGGQSSAGMEPGNPAAAAFGYAPPSLSDWYRQDRPRAACAPIRRTYPGPNGTIAIKDVPAQCYDTRGDFALVLAGSSLSASPAAVAVTVGGRRCEMTAASHNALVCTVPQGLGDANAIVVTVGDQSAAGGPGFVFAYDPPIVDAIVPSTPDALGGAVVLRGKNFGFTATAVAVNVSGVPALQAAWAGDGMLTFTTAEDVVGPKSLALTVANRSSPYTLFDFEGVFITECKRGFSGLDGEACVDCAKRARGAVCPGGEHAIDLVTAARGWWRADVPTPSPLCLPEQAGRPACPVFSPCYPLESCLGANVCALGYEGERCAYCLKGAYYRVNGECIKCPDSPWAAVVIFGLAGLAALGLSYALNRYRVSITLLSIGIDYAQVVSMFVRVKVNWPASLRQVFAILSAFNLNLDLAAPECISQTISFGNKWAFVELLPAVTALLLAAVYGADVAYKRSCRNVARLDRHAALPGLIALFITVMRLLYLYVTRMTLDVFNCAPTDPPDGKEYMAGMLDQVCDAPGSLHGRLLPWAVLTLLVYSLGLPAAALALLRRKRTAVVYDQILRARGSGDDRLTNPRYHAFRRAFGRLYSHFTPACWYWELVITGRKFLIAFTSLMFRNTPSYQLSVALLVLFAAYALHVRHGPYLTHVNRHGVLAEHAARASAGDPLHAAIKGEMRDVALKNSRPGSRLAGDLFAAVAARRADTGAPGRRGDLGAHMQGALLALFDYNTVEAVLLASACLLNLAGIMFDSARFNGDNLTFYRREYDSLAYSTTVLVGLSILYYLLVLAADLVVVCAPELAARALVATQRAGSGLQARLDGGRNRRGGEVHKAGQAKGQSQRAVREDEGDEERSGASVALTSNPLLLLGGAASMAGGAGSLSDSGALLLAGAGLSPDALERMRGLPDEATWAAVRAQLVQQAVVLADVQRQLKLARAAAELGGGGGGSRSTDPPTASHQRRTRREFVPTASTGTAGRLEQSGSPASLREGLSASLRRNGNRGAPGPMGLGLPSVNPLRTAPGSGGRAPSGGASALHSSSARFVTPMRALSPRASPAAPTQGGAAAEVREIGEVSAGSTP
jgi:hypothetical protein